MAEKMGSRDLSERENWDNIFKGLVKILRTKQDQLESLLKDRKIMEERINTQHNRWVSDVRLYEDQLSLMNGEIETVKMMRLIEVAKSDLLVGLKGRDASICKAKLEQTLEDLDDFKAWFDFLTLNSNNKTDKSLKTEMRKMRLEYEKLASEKNCEVSTLLRENGFVWNQFKRLESDFTEKLKRKDDEISLAHTKALSLISHQEQLQSSNHEKDEIIRNLEARVAQLENDASKKDAEISKLSQEIESLKKPRSSKLTPVLTRCTSRKNTLNGKALESNEATKKGLPDSIIEESKRMKRKDQKNNPSSETPKLFSSSFKVPKLKDPCPGALQLS